MGTSKLTRVTRVYSALRVVLAYSPGTRSHDQKGEWLRLRTGMVQKSDSDAWQYYLEYQRAEDFEQEGAKQMVSPLAYKPSVGNSVYVILVDHEQTESDSTMHHPCC